MAKVKVFISWSGDLSHAIAQHLYSWLPDVLQCIEPWISTEDLRKGLRWSLKLNDQLRESSLGIIVLTSENRIAPWILFETGALSKAVLENHCCTLLCDLKPSDVAGPLAQFQGTILTSKEDMFRLISTINDTRGDAKDDSAKVKGWFDQYWDGFESKFQEELDKKPEATETEADHPTQRELLEEVVDTVRQIARNQGDPQQFPVSWGGKKILAGLPYVYPHPLSGTQVWTTRTTHPQSDYVSSTPSGDELPDEKDGHD